MTITRRPPDVIIEDVLAANNIPDFMHERFLNPNYEEIHNTHNQFPDMDVATARIHHAIAEKERILVWGDFDVDGLTATAIMVRTLRYLGAKPEWYIPDRRVESHGLNRAGIKKECANRDLMIIVDCGITNYQEIKYAKHLGCDVILTDHHQPRERIPDADARLYLTHEIETKFSGAGIAFKLAQALTIEKEGWFAESLLWLAMLGTVVDCVPQTHENRVISALGLQQINRETPACIRALAIESEMKRPINKNQISWKLGPMLNSASRLSMAKVAQDILLAEEEDTSKILGLAKELRDINEERKDVLETFYQIGLSKAMKQFDDTNQSSIAVVFDMKEDGDARGIQGILAARLSEEHLGIPTFVFTDVGNGTLIGSARTPRHDFPTLLNSVQDLIIGGGGHSVVGGLSLYTENLHEFVETIDDNVHSAMYPAHELYNKIPLQVSEITHELHVALSALEPYGDGDSPLFEITCKLTGQHSIMGQNKNHIKFEITDGSDVCDVLFWNKAGDLEETFRNPELRDTEYIVKGRLKINDWTGSSVIEIEAVKILQEQHEEGNRYEISL